MYQPRPQARFLPSPFCFCTPVICSATSPPPAQPSTMPSIFPDTDWACEACTHPNKGGKTCVTCHPMKAPPQAGAAPPPAIEMVAASTDPLSAASPGMPRARGGAPPAIEETATTLTDQLPVVFPNITHCLCRRLASLSPPSPTSPPSSLLSPLSL